MKSSCGGFNRFIRRSPIRGGSVSRSGDGLAGSVGNPILLPVLCHITPHADAAFSRRRVSRNPPLPMPAWKYVKAGFWQRVSLPVFGRVPLNVAALAGFAVAGMDNPALWFAGAIWQTAWLSLTAGRHHFRRKIDAQERREAWRVIEERRLQLYNQLPRACRLRHHQLREACRQLILPHCGSGPLPAAELLTWLHLKLLLARHQALSGAPRVADPDAPRLHAGLAVEITDPVQARLADETIGLLDPRLGPHDPAQPLIPAIDTILQRLESELARLLREGTVSVGEIECLAHLAAAEAAELPASPGSLNAAGEEVQTLICGMAE